MQTAPSLLPSSFRIARAVIINARICRAAMQRVRVLCRAFVIRETVPSLAEIGTQRPAASNRPVLRFERQTRLLDRLAGLLIWLIVIGARVRGRIRAKSPLNRDAENTERCIRERDSTPEQRA